MQYNNQNYRSPGTKSQEIVTSQTRKTRLVIDESTIYEVDTECENCKKKYESMRNPDYLHNREGRR